MDEEWLSILEFPDYMVSNYGRIYSIRRDRVLKPGGITNSGYLQAHFGRRESRKVRYIHRLVASAFFEKPIDGFEIDHLDGDKTNNAIWNLEIVTPSENSQRNYDRNHRVPPRMIPVRIVETGERFRSISDCSRFLNRSVSSTYHALHNNTPVAGYHVEREVV